jgi:RNA polymerase sigma factor (sigma-70 family)
MTEGKRLGLGERLKALQAQAEAGDRQALDQLIALIRPQLLAAAAAQGGKKHASSIAQEACLRLAQGIATGTDVENVLAFARRIVRNLTIDQARRQARRPAVAAAPQHLGNLPASTGTPSSNAARAEMREKVRDMLGRLDPAVRRVVEDRYFEELGWEELAAKHGLPSGEAARKMVQRALATLGERVGDE